MNFTQARLVAWANENAETFRERQRVFNKHVVGTLCSLFLMCMSGAVFTELKWYGAMAFVPVFYIVSITGIWYMHSRIERRLPILTFEEWDTKNPDTVKASGLLVGDTED